MLSPNQIKMQSFPQVGRGAYRAQEVDAFLQRIYQNYTDLYTENANMKKKFSSLTSIVEEYNEGKNAIATALVKAQAVADQTLDSAKKQAEETVAEAESRGQALLAAKVEEAESYAKEKKATADAYFQKAETELQRILSEAQAQSRDYVNEVNAKAAAIIADANEKAANLVAAAYKDAQLAQQKADEIIAKAQVELQTTKNAVAAFRQGALTSLQQLLPLVEGLAVEGDLTAEVTAMQSAELPQVEATSAEVPKFDLETLFDSFDMTAATEETKAENEEQASAFDVEDEAEPEAQTAEDEAAHVEPLDETPEETPLFSGAKDDAETAAMPVYHPFEAPKQDLFTTSLFDLKEADVEDVSLSDEAPAAAPKFSEQDVTEEPNPLKFKLTKNFDIFDEDE